MSAAPDDDPPPTPPVRLDDLPDHIVVHVLKQLPPRSHRHQRILLTQSEGDALNALSHEKRFLHVNADEDFDEGYLRYCLDVSPRPDIEPARNFRNALANKWGSLMSFSYSSRRYNALARDADLWKAHERALQAAFPLTVAPGSDLPTVVRRMITVLKHALVGHDLNAVRQWLDPRIEIDAIMGVEAAPVPAEPYARTVALATYVTRVLSRMETVVDQLMQMEGGSYHIYFARHVMGALDLTLTEGVGVNDVVQAYQDKPTSYLRHAILCYLVYDVWRKEGCVAKKENFFGYDTFPMMAVCLDEPEPCATRAEVDTPNSEGRPMYPSEEGAGPRDHVLAWLMEHLGCTEAGEGRYCPF